jgi:hypothetical protein
MPPFFGAGACAKAAVAGTKAAMMAKASIFFISISSVEF